MTKQQRAALVALRDVMHEHKICFDARHDDFEVMNSTTKETVCHVPFNWVFASDINQILEQEQE